MCYAQILDAGAVTAGLWFDEDKKSSTASGATKKEIT